MRPRSSLFPTCAAVLTAIAALAMAPSVHGQTLVVDAAGGPGAHFRDLPEAVAAAPDGAVLRVRPGTYSEFGWSGKGLTILGDGAASVVVAQRAPMRITATRPGQDVVIAGLTIDLRAQPASSTRWIWFDGLGGALVLDAVVFNVAASASMAAGAGAGAGTSSGSGATWQERVVIERCANAHLHGCTLRSAAVWDPGVMLSLGNGTQVEMDGCDVRGWSGAGAWPGHAVAARFARLLAIGSTLRGGDALTGYGGAGLLAEYADITALACDIAGGDAPRGRGGDGVSASWSRVHLEGFTPAGGGGAAPGFAWTPDPSTTFLHDPAARPLVARARGTQLVRGGSLAIDVSGAPGSLAALWLGPAAAFAPLEPLAPFATGALLCAPSWFGGAFLLPLSGAVELQLAVPANFPLDLPVYGQCVAVEPSPARLWASNSLALFAKS